MAHLLWISFLVCSCFIIEAAGAAKTIKVTFEVILAKEKFAKDMGDKTKAIYKTTATKFCKTVGVEGWFKGDKEIQKECTASDFKGADGTAPITGKVTLDFISSDDKATFTKKIKAAIVKKSTADSANSKPVADKGITVIWPADPKGNTGGRVRPAYALQVAVLLLALVLFR